MTSLVCYESNFVNSHDLHNTWWIDSGTTIHVSTVMQGFQNLRKPVRANYASIQEIRCRQQLKVLGHTD